LPHLARYEADFKYTLHFDLFMKQTGIKLDYFNKFDECGTWIDFWQNGVWHFTTGPIIYQVNGSKLVCCAMWICIFCLLPSKHRCILVKWNFFALRVYTKCIYNSRFNAGCSVKSPVSVNTAIGYPFQVCLLE